MQGSKSSPYFIGGVIFCLLGAVCFSTKAVIVKLAYRDTPVDAVSLLALRMLFALPFFVISAAMTSRQRSNVKFTAKQWIYVAVIGMLGYYVSSLLDFLGLQYISAGMERLILFIYPTLVVLMSAVFYRQKIKRYQWVALAVTYAGLLLAFRSEVTFTDHQHPDFILGSVLIFLCAITYALYIVGSGRLIPLVGPAKFNSYAMSFAAAGVLIHFFIVSDKSLFQFSMDVYVYSLFMAVIATIIPTYLISEGIKRIGSDNAAIIGSIGPVSTILQAYFLLQEPIAAMQLAGTGLVLIGILLIGRKGKQAEIPPMEVSQKTP